ncbi:MAG: DUF1460 domain-containing protein [Deltaproteobacteria bacterium]|nr:DUF1460 domain-containing protein [Deltaproteobacteria bacterium]
MPEELSAGHVALGELTLQLELGRFTVGGINALLAEAHRRYPDPGARLYFLAEHFVGTPFLFESRLPLPEPGTLRVRLASFGCTGFVLTMLALAHAHDFEELAWNLRLIRYWGEGTIDSDPEHGSILDFAYDIFVDSAAGTHRMVRDVTTEVAPPSALDWFSSRVTRRQRTAEYDPERRWINPRLHAGEAVSAQLITRAGIQTMDRSAIHSGDILLFSRVDPSKPLGEEPLIGHCALAFNLGGEIFLLHATRDYYWRPDASAETPALGTGIFVADDPRREQIGVGWATAPADDLEGKKLKVGSIPHYGYQPRRLRPLKDYIKATRIRGIMVLRPLDRAGTGSSTAVPAAGAPD